MKVSEQSEFTRDAGSSSSPSSTVKFRQPESSQVGTLAKHGVGWSGGSIALRYIVSMGITAILARIISPNDYGLMGMVVTFTGLIQTFGDLGLSLATVQRKDITDDQIDCLFWINCLVGVLLTLLCVAGAPLVAAFYGRAELQKITLGCGAAMLFAAVSVQPLALLRRQMKFRELSVLQTYALIVSSVAAVWAAMRGWGYWALVVQTVGAQLCTAVLGLRYSGYSPRRPTQFAGIAPLLMFGGYTSVYGLVNYFARNLDNVLVGKFFGAVPLGYYSRAYFLMTLPGTLIITIFGGVMIPALAALRHDSERMQSAYIRTTRIIALFGCSLAAAVAVAAPEITAVLYGKTWAPIVPIVICLSIAGIVQPVTNTAQWLTIVAEDGKRMLYLGIIVTTSAAIGIGAGVPFGPTGVAIGYSIANVFVAVPVLAIGHRALRMKLGATLRSIVPVFSAVFIATAAAVAAGLLARTLHSSSLTSLALKLGIGGITLCVALMSLARPLWHELMGRMVKHPPARLAIRERE
jgi:PST family polysaccharide transporter